MNNLLKVLAAANFVCVGFNISSVIRNASEGHAWLAVFATTGIFINLAVGSLLLRDR